MEPDASGLDDFDKSVNHLVSRLTGDQLDALTQAAGDEILKEIETRAPVRTGDLKASVETMSSHNGSRSTTSLEVANSSKKGVVHYAVFLEFGTCKMAAKPFMRPAFEASKQRAVSVFENELEKIIRE